MITGFNTDIKHGERVFHVQTEDRGVGNPVVESLVYVGGEILLSKKSSYGPHVAEGRVDEKVVREIMDLQHRRIIEAIRRGRFDAAAGGGSGAPPPDELTDGGSPFTTQPGVSPAAAAAAAAILSSRSGAMPAVRPQMPPPAPRPPAVPPMTPSAGPRPASSPALHATEKSLDQVIMDYLASEAASEHLDVALMKGGELVSGDTVSLTVRASTSLTEKPVVGAHISIRVVSTVSPPRVLFRGVTGSDGLVKTTCEIPDIGTAHAALIIAASSPLGNNEVKETIRKRLR